MFFQVVSGVTCFLIQWVITLSVSKTASLSLWVPWLSVSNERRAGRSLPYPMDWTCPGTFSNTLGSWKIRSFIILGNSSPFGLIMRVLALKSSQKRGYSTRITSVCARKCSSHLLLVIPCGMAPICLHNLLPSAWTTSFLRLDSHRPYSSTCQKGP